MKKLAITCALLSGMVVSQVWADAASDLKSRLDKVSSFHASFTQKVTDGSGNAVQDGQGDLWVKRPNLFNWHMTQPMRASSFRMVKRCGSITRSSSRPWRPG